MTIRYAIFLAVLLGVGMYTFTSIRSLSTNVWVHRIYGIIAIVGFILLASIFSFDNKDLRHKVEEQPWMATFFFLLIGFLLMQILWSAIILVDDLRAVFVFVIKKIVLWYNNRPPAKTPHENAITFSRSTFLQWLAFSFGSFVFCSMIWGMRNKYNYQVHRQYIKLNGLSDGWKGFKIVQISDIHSGSFQWKDKKDIEKGIELIHQEKPDIIFFTGDLVNNIAVEFEKWKASFSILKAPLGIYSILGNHDYGDYYQWNSIEEKRANLEHLKQLQAEMGWKLLNNESVYLTKDGATDKIALVGVENWSSKSQFPKYGKLDEALSGLSPDIVKILLSHDPSHWDAQVVARNPSIKLTLSGHTHGMQFGLETPFFRWSPVQWMYKQWAGLYQKGDQWLYVNRGFGFLGYPGRVGILPEVTVLQLI